MDGMHVKGAGAGAITLTQHWQGRSTATNGGVVQ